MIKKFLEDINEPFYDEKEYDANVDNICNLISEYSSKVDKILMKNKLNEKFVAIRN